MDDLPCPECDGWMRRAEGRWSCPSCGYQAEVEPDEAPAPAAAAAPEDAFRTRVEAAVQEGVATSQPAERRLPGRPRSFGVSLLLGIVTLGLYFIYWHYKVFREVHDDQGDDSWAVLLFLSVLVGFANGVLRLAARDFMASEGVGIDVTLQVASTGFLLGYLLMETANLDGLLLGLGRRPSQAKAWLAGGTILSPVVTVLEDPGLQILFALAGLAQLIVGYVRLQDALNRYWEAAKFRPAAQPAEPAQPDAAGTSPAATPPA